MHAKISVNAGAIYAHKDAEVRTSPSRTTLATIHAQKVSPDLQHGLQALSQLNLICHPAVEPSNSQ